MGKLIGMIIAIVVVVAMVVVAFFMFGGDSADDAMTINGQATTWDDISELEMKTVNGNEGVSLSAILNETDFADLPDDDKEIALFTIIAEDGWQKNVSWLDMQTGILQEEDMMTNFPDLLGAYKIKNVVSIEKVELGALAIIKADASWSSSAELTWTGMFDELDTVNFTAGQDYEGTRIERVLEYAGFTDLTNSTLITIVGADGYSKTVNWTSVQNGYLVEEHHMSAFPDLSNKFKVRNIIRIVVE